MYKLNNARNRSEKDNDFLRALLTCIPTGESNAKPNKEIVKSFLDRYNTKERVYYLDEREFRYWVNVLRHEDQVPVLSLPGVGYWLPSSAEELEHVSAWFVSQANLYKNTLRAIFKAYRVQVGDQVAFSFPDYSSVPKMVAMLQKIERNKFKTKPHVGTKTKEAI